MRDRAVLPWLVHALTASGAFLAYLALVAIIAGDLRAAFLWLTATTVIDAIDGMLARLARVKERLPQFDGALLDNIIDYMTYVFVPALIVWQANLVPVPFPVCSAMLLSSAYGFANTAAKVESGDHFFTGFPSYWNIVVVYLYILQLPPIVNAAILSVLAILVFVPIRYIYPSRTKTLQLPTLILGAAWAALSTWMIFRLPATDGPWTALSLVFPAWYVG